MTETTMIAKPDRMNELSNETQIAARVFEQEAIAVASLQTILDEQFSLFINRLLELEGRIVVSGMGKSGHIANKISSTLSSTGTPSIFVHPGEAGHGDLGMITRSDIVLLLSNSGNTEELTPILHYCKRFSIPIAAIVGDSKSMLGSHADTCFTLPPFKEASPHVNAPTTSTTMMLAFGDALAVTLMEKRGFTAEDFSLFHPGGQIGAQLKRVEDVMHVDKDLPVAHESTLMSEVLITMTSKHFGCIAVVGSDQKLKGIITDGDLRRNMDHAFLDRTAAEIMTPNPLVIKKSALLSEVLQIMNSKSVTNLFVLNDDKQPIGIIHIHDCLRAGVV